MSTTATLVLFWSKSLTILVRFLLHLAAICVRVEASADKSAIQLAHRYRLLRRCTVACVFSIVPFVSVKSRENACDRHAENAGHTKITTGTFDTKTSKCDFARISLSQFNAVCRKSPGFFRNPCNETPRLWDRYRTGLKELGYYGRSFPCDVPVSAKRFLRSR